MKVRDRLEDRQQALVTVGLDDTLHVASQRLAEHNIGLVLVMDEAGKPVGVLSERDVVREFARHGGGCESLLAREVMTEDPIIGVPDDELAEVAAIMMKQHVRHIPIVDGGTLVGLISIRDVVQAEQRASNAELRRLRMHLNSMV